MNQSWMRICICRLRTIIGWYVGRSFSRGGRASERASKQANGCFSKLFEGLLGFLVLHHLHSFLSLTHLENGDPLRASELTILKFQAKIRNCYVGRSFSHGKRASKQTAASQNFLKDY